MSSPTRERLTARVAPAGIQSLSLSEPNNIRPKPRIAWHRRPLFSPGLDGDHLVEHLEGPAGEEWTFREPSHSQGVCTKNYSSGFLKIKSGWNKNSFHLENILST